MPLLTIAGNTYSYPDPGTEPGWGEDATGWASAVTQVLGTLIGPGDILETSFTIQDNISSYTLIGGMRFDSAFVRAANISYAINRNGTEQSGTLQLNYSSSGSPGNKWSIIETDKNGDVGVIFNVTDTGQVQYESTSTGFSGQIKFYAKTLSQ